MLTIESDSPSLEETIAAARRGESWAEDRLVDEMGYLSEWICSRGPVPDLGGLDWQDVAQEATVRLFESGLIRYRGEGSARGYLYTIVKVSMLGILRGTSRRRAREVAAAEMAEPGSPPSGEGAERRLLARQVLESLDAECRELIETMFYGGATYRQIAEETGLAESSVRSKLSRCLRRAREHAH